LKSNNFRRNSLLENLKLGEVKHSSNSEKKSNEMSLVVASEYDFRHKKLIRI